MPAQQSSKELKKFQEETVNHVLTHVEDLNNNGGLHLPKDFSAPNALKFAWLRLLETQDSNSKPVLESCSKESICNALLDMVVMGLNPMKKQCAFIAYGGKLHMQPEYHGNIALAKRYGNLKNITANVVYEGDEFKYSVDPATGRKRIVTHEQTMENIDLNKIRGAYATVELEDGTTDVEVMTIFQIRKSWAMGKGGGNTKAHKEFPDQMAAKTVINRACKLLISTSDDSALLEGREDEDYQDPIKVNKEEQIKEKANRKPLNIEDVESVEVKDEPIKQPDQEQPEPQDEPQPEMETAEGRLPNF